MLAKDTIKKQVPIQVYRDCADIINKALYHDRKAVKQHKKRENKMKSRYLNNSSQLSTTF